MNYPYVVDGPLKLTTEDRMLMKPLRGETYMNLNQLADICYHQAKEKGFHDNDGDNNPAERLALIASEVFEAFEDVRAGRPLNENYGTGDKPEGVPSELADIIIRTLDLSTEWGVDIQGAVTEKLAYNRTRDYRHGKKF